MSSHPESTGLANSTTLIEEPLLKSLDIIMMLPTEGSRCESTQFAAQVDDGSLLDSDIRKQMAKMRFFDSSKAESTKIAALPTDEMIFVPPTDERTKIADDIAKLLTDEKIFVPPTNERTKIAGEIAAQPTDFVLPTDELADKIVQQLEMYFTDFNIMIDSFMRKLIRMNTEGYVSLQFVASFPRVRELTEDWRTVRHAIRRSKILKLSKSGRKVKRMEPVPSVENTPWARSVILMNVSEYYPTSKGIHQQMKRYGTVKNVTLFEPQSVIPEMLTMKLLSRHGQQVNRSFAVVEFEKFQSTQIALVSLKNEMKIVRLSDVYKGVSLTGSRSLHTRNSRRSRRKKSVGKEKTNRESEEVNTRGFTSISEYAKRLRRKNEKSLLSASGKFKNTKAPTSDSSSIGDSLKKGNVESKVSKGTDVLEMMRNLKGGTKHIKVDKKEVPAIFVRTPTGPGESGFPGRKPMDFPIDSKKGKTLNFDFLITEEAR